MKISPTGLLQNANVLVEELKWFEDRGISKDRLLEMVTTAHSENREISRDEMQAEVDKLMAEHGDNIIAIFPALELEIQPEPKIAQPNTNE